MHAASNTGSSIALIGLQRGSANSQKRRTPSTFTFPGEYVLTSSEMISLVCEESVLYVCKIRAGVYQHNG